MYCMFVGSSSNLSLLLWQCGLCDKLINEAMLVIACQSKSSRISRDPLHSFVYDNKAGTVLVALMCIIVSCMSIILLLYVCVAY